MYEKLTAEIRYYRFGDGWFNVFLSFYDGDKLCSHADEQFITKAYADRSKLRKHRRVRTFLNMVREGNRLRGHAQSQIIYLDEST